MVSGGGPHGSHPPPDSYFAYGSNMDPARVRQRGLNVRRAEPARLDGFDLEFRKRGHEHPRAGHANIAWARGQRVEGVLYTLECPEEIRKMDRFERAPVNYSRDIVVVETDAGPRAAWTYFANPAVLADGLLPPRAYLDHLRAGAAFLSAAWLVRLETWPCLESSAGER